METETKTDTMVEQPTIETTNSTPILSNTFKSPAKSTSTSVSNICTNCDNSGLSCSVCGYNKP